MKGRKKRSAFEVEIRRETHLNKQEGIKRSIYLISLCFLSHCSGKVIPNWIFFVLKDKDKTKRSKTTVTKTQKFIKTEVYNLQE
ncbi:hypothetical protein CARUB_v10010779mg [Capsella rubella]|uniref:Uncharacterized protein n=1 Tax=Capsella rubella TaxID=81985 RepID=R0IFX8_9BRAS|nr:hypothetical protein CARUB_v10010779mg [Capsella rubella]